MPVVLSREQIRRVDQLAVERYAIPTIILMENAGRGAAEIIDRRYGPGREAMIFCGVGNNGGDGLVIARHLHRAGWRVSCVVIGDEPRTTQDARTNLEIVRRISSIDLRFGLSALDAAGTAPNIVLVDALLGTGFSGTVRSPVREAIARINEMPRRAVVSIDVPSGLDCDNGSASDPTVAANLTITFVAAKRGFDVPAARRFVGEVEVTGIGTPPELIDAVLGGA